MEPKTGVTCSTLVPSVNGSVELMKYRYRWHAVSGCTTVQIDYCVVIHYQFIQDRKNITRESKEQIRLFMGENLVCSLKSVMNDMIVVG